MSDRAVWMDDVHLDPATPATTPQTSRGGGPVWMDAPPSPPHPSAPPPPSSAPADETPDWLKTAGGYAAALGRPLAGMAAGVGLPALAAGPAGAAAGLAYEGGSGLYDLAQYYFPKTLPERGWPTAQELIDPLLTKQGVPSGRESWGQRAVSNMAPALTGAGAAQAATKAVPTLLSALRPAAASSGLVTLAQEGGVEDPLTLAALGAAAGGGAPTLKRGLAKAITSTKQEPMADVARRKGYSIPPDISALPRPPKSATAEEAASPLYGKGPTGMASFLTRQAGPEDVRLRASSENQKITNRLVREELGLSPDARLTPWTLGTVREEASQAYRAFAGSTPEIALDATVEKELSAIADPVFWRNSVSKAALRQPAIEEMANTTLDALRKGESLSPDTLLHDIRAFRATAARNLNNAKDPNAQALGLAQRAIATSLEDFVERGIERAPQYWAQKVAYARTDLGNLRDSLKSASHAVDRAKQAYATLDAEIHQRAAGEGTTPEVFIQRRPGIQRSIADRAKAVADAHRSATSLLERMEGAEKALADASETHQNVLERSAASGAIVPKMKAARELIAKTYDVESALTGTTSGDVNAHVLQALAKKGKPLTGKLKEISDIAGAFPEATRSRVVGQQEHGWGQGIWSTAHIVSSAAGGHWPVLATIAAMKPSAGKALLSESVQRPTTGWKELLPTLTALGMTNLGIPPQ